MKIWIKINIESIQQTQAPQLSHLAVRSGKKSPNQETGLGNRGCLKVLNATTLILNDYGGNSCSFRTNLVSFRTFRRHLFPKPISWLGLFCHFLQQDSSSWVTGRYMQFLAKFKQRMILQISSTCNTDNCFTQSSHPTRARLL